MRRTGSRRPQILARFREAFLLSAREADVVALASLGHGCKEIAFQLGCGRSTVDIYWTRIYRKTGCGSHLEVMAALLQMSMAENSSPAGERQQQRRDQSAGGRGRGYVARDVLVKGHPRQETDPPRS